jgi:hypothetical protein
VRFFPVQSVSHRRSSCFSLYSWNKRKFICQWISETALSCRCYEQWNYMRATETRDLLCHKLKKAPSNDQGVRTNLTKQKPFPSSTTQRTYYFSGFVQVAFRTCRARHVQMRLSRPQTNLVPSSGPISKHHTSMRPPFDHRANTNTGMDVTDIAILTLIRTHCMWATRNLSPPPSLCLYNFLR